MRSFGTTVTMITSVSPPHVESLKVSNVVFCFKVKFRHPDPLYTFEEKLLQALEKNKHTWVWRKHRNFYVLQKATRHRFIVFSSSGHVNCTGNGDFDVDVERSIDVFNGLWCLDDISREDCKIVNSTLTGRLAEEVDLHRLRRCVNNKEWWFTLRPGIFPSAVLRHVAQERPTNIVFANGKVNVVGAKNAKSAEEAFGEIKKAYHHVCG
jgi:TATA-box binding protein (TBP) (component of TFIID and TFIIIB)